EREALTRLHHPNIARILAAGAVSDEGPFAGRPYFVMEFVEGLPITEFASSRALSSREILKLVADVAGAVQYAHQNGIIHRDLNPENILVTEEMGSSVPKIIDFGIAKALAPPSPLTTLLTAQSELLGTLAYMSPEQALGDPRAVDTRTDVYA